MVSIHSSVVAAQNMHGHFLFSFDVGPLFPAVSCSLSLTNKLFCSAGLFNMRVRIHVAYGLIAATYIATICSILFGCRPLHKNWQIYPDPGSTWDFHLVPYWITDCSFLRSLPAGCVQNRYLCDGRFECDDRHISHQYSSTGKICPRTHQPSCAD